MKPESASNTDRVWQGRIQSDLEPHAQVLNDSLPVDKRLWPEEVALSSAYAQALHEAGVLDIDELKKLLAACQQLELALRQNRVELKGEDIHEAIQIELIYRANSAANKIHTGRSRNDQVSTLLRMHVMKLCDEAVSSIRQLERAILFQAKGAGDQMVAAYTHLQPAQPVLLAHWWLAHAAALQRDETRFMSAKTAADELPLGAGAVAGSPLVYDRGALAARLGFTRMAVNSIDVVGDRDFALGYLQAAVQLGLHLSRLAEDLVLACSPGFGWFIPPDGFSTGSSLLPQKRNPDLFELIRGKSGRLVSNAERLAIVLKGLPSSYQKDLQEDKEAVFDTGDTLELVLAVLPDAIRALEARPQKMDESLRPELTAVDLADALIGEGLVFRDAHKAVGQLYAAAERAGMSPANLPIETRMDICPALTEELLQSVSYTKSVARRNQAPGTGEASVASQIQHLEAHLGKANEATGAVASVREVVAQAAGR
jgi:argininosuccinate lyase